MKVRYSDENPLGLSLFLAGPTPRSSSVKSWRPEALKILRRLKFKGTVFVPERRDWTVKFDYTDQVNWEKTSLAHGSAIVFWVPRKMDTMPALDTNVEFGYWMHKDPRKVTYGRPDDSERNRYLDWLYRETTGKEPCTTLEETLRTAVDSLSGRK